MRRRTRSSPPYGSSSTFRGDCRVHDLAPSGRGQRLLRLLRRKRRRPLLQHREDEDDERPEPSSRLPTTRTRSCSPSTSRRRSREVPEEFRVVLVLADVQDLPYDEIAAVLDIPVGTVKSRVFRGRAALGRALGIGARGTLTRVTGVRGRGMNHPYEQLADLLDGTLDEERPRRGAGASGHLRLLPRGSCARRAAGREAARSLPEAAAPADLHRRVVAAAGGRGHGTSRRGTGGRAWPRLRPPWSSRSRSRSRTSGATVGRSAELPEDTRDRAEVGRRAAACDATRRRHPVEVAEHRTATPKRSKRSPAPPGISVRRQAPAARRASVTRSPTAVRLRQPGPSGPRQPGRADAG